MLFRRESPTAISAAFSDAGVKQQATKVEETTFAANGASPPGPRDAQLKELEAQNLALREELQRSRDGLAAAVKQAAEHAREQAARAHVRQDEELARQLEHACREARHKFDEMLQDAFARSAGALAAAALNRLVIPLESEFTWLGRTIAYRLDRLQAEAVVRLEVNPGMLGAQQWSDIADRLPAGMSIIGNPSVPNGTARIVLKLGEIAVDPADGREALQRALAACDSAGDD